jgi:hypothetical protein
MAGRFLIIIRLNSFFYQWLYHNNPSMQITPILPTPRMTVPLDHFLRLLRREFFFIFSLFFRLASCFADIMPPSPNPSLGLIVIFSLWS